MEKEPMTEAEQAVLLWPMLALAARTQQILSYAAVEGYTGIARHGLNRALGLIHDYCKRRGWPLLNTIGLNRFAVFGSAATLLPKRITRTSVPE